MGGRLALLLALSLNLVGGGCLLLSPREAEKPVTTGFNRTPPLTASELLNNLEQSIVARNPVMYMQSYDAAGFVYTGDPEALTRYGTALTGFDYTREQRFAQNLFSRSTIPIDSSVSATFHLISEQPSSSGVTIEMEYRIEAGMILNIPRVVSARASLLLIRADDGGFVIQTWRDIRTGSDPALSEWRALL